MGRTIVGVVAGFVVWSLLWLGGNAVVLGEAGRKVRAGEPLMETGPLVTALVMSVVCSVAAGVAAGWIAKGRELTAGRVLGVVLFLVGLAFQASAWKQMPVWYHLVFIALLEPVTALGARLVRRK
jgi:hypothetical protein